MSAKIVWLTVCLHYRIGSGTIMAVQQYVIDMSLLVHGLRHDFRYHCTITGMPLPLYCYRYIYITAWLPVCLHHCIASGMSFRQPINIQPLKGYFQTAPIMQQAICWFLSDLIESDTSAKSLVVTRSVSVYCRSL